MEENVGTIVIGTKVDNSGANKDLQKLYDKVEENDKKLENLMLRKKQLDIDTNKYQRKIETAGKKTEELANKIEDLAKTQLFIEDLPVTEENMTKMKDYLSSLNISELPENKQISKQAQWYQEAEAEFMRYVNQIEEAESKLDILDGKYERINKEIMQAQMNQIKFNQEIENANQQKGFSGISLNLENVQKNVGKIEKGFSKLGKKALRLGLALIGIRTIINLITRSFNTLAEYNDELNIKMQQMRLVLAVALEPVINWILSLVQQILSFINQIYSLFSGINLFGRASELWSKKMAKNMASGAGSAKEIKKQLAGFDEMNVLQDNEVSGGGGGGSSMEPWQLEETERPGWMDWILENGDVIAGILAGIATAWTLIKLGIDLVKATGIGVIIAGIVMLIIDIIKYLKDPSWENFGKIIRDIGIILIGIGIVIGGIPGLIVAIIGVIVMLVGIIIEHWDKIKEKILGVAEWLHNKAEELKSKGQGFLGGLFELFSKAVEDIVFIFENIVGTIKNVFDDIIQFFRDVFKGDWKSAWEDIKKIFTDIWDGLVALVKKTWERLKENLGIVKEMVQNLISSLYNWLYQKIEGIYNTVVGIKNKIHNVIESGVNWIISKFNQVTNFFKDVGVAIGDFFSSAIKGAVNSMFTWVENKINSFIRAINKVISKVNEIPGVNLSKLSTISLPRLATGGIINQPGRGVPVGGAIAGEAGREGILPLTDERAMAQLGREIGRWITVNATIPVSVGNRQIAREVRQFMADQDFATNR